MASSSNGIIQYNSSSSMIRTYDVFVSFRGEDTRNNFTSFLLRDLSKDGIEAFKDDTHIQKGQFIAPELVQAIQASCIFIVVFSKNYASSTWCLRELAHIWTCIQTSQRRVLPIFYDVHPSEVQRQSGCYEKAFAEHEGRFREDKEKMEEVQIWREALTKVANLAGWDIQNKPQYAEIEEIFQKIKNILGHKFLCLPKENLVGIESRVEKLLEILCFDSINDVQIVGVSGMGGIGKTTLVHSLYERISEQYDFCCFVDVNKIYQDSNTLGVQKQLLFQCLNEENLEISNASEGTYLVWTRLRHTRTLIILDNVENIEQLNMFTGNRETLLHDCLGGGSKIIIISRDEHVLRTHGAEYVYQVQPLNDKDAIQLFYRYAFKGNDITYDYEKLTSRVLSHVQGHPLAIQVLDSSLFNRNILQWRSVLARLEEKKSENIMDVLQLSFDQLDDIDKEIFLDIACFFNHSKEEYVMEFLDFRGFHPEFGLQILIDKSLITIENGLIEMHTLLIDFGRSIVRKKSPKEPRKWSRLWAFQDLNKIISDNMGFENLEAIADCVDHEMTFYTPTIKVDALSKMSKLKFLKVEKLKFYGSLNHLCNELGYLIWRKYHLKSLPPSFQPDNLVELSLRESNIKHLWKDKKALPNLRRLDLSNSKNLMKVPNLTEALNLCRLNLYGCEKLKELHPSIGHLRKLTLLDLRYCTSLIKLPRFKDNLNLETLNLGGCIQLKEINPSVGFLRKLTFLNLCKCENLVSLPNSIFYLNSLEYLNLSHCSKLFGIQLLHEPSVEKNLKLCVSEGATYSHSAPSIIKRWFTRPLHLLHSRAHKVSLSCLFTALHVLPCLCGLNLRFCNLAHIPDAIRNLHFLEILHLEGNNFSTLPSLKELSKLYVLNLKDCRQLKYLPDLPSQTHLSSKRLQIPDPIIAYLVGRYHYSNEAGLNIYGCTELVEMECCNNTTFSWTMQFLQAHYQYTRLQYLFMDYQYISSIIPGSEIPSWFNNQHKGMGSFITIHESPLMQHANDCIGLLFCLVFARFPGMETVFRLDPLRTKSLNILIMLNMDEGQVTNDHLWMFYSDLPLWKMTRCDAHSKLEIDIRTIGSMTIEVKNYGYRWVDEKDLEISNSEKFISN